RRSSGGRAGRRHRRCLRARRPRLRDGDGDGGARAARPRGGRGGRRRRGPTGHRHRRRHRRTGAAVARGRGARRGGRRRGQRGARPGGRLCAAGRAPRSRAAVPMKVAVIGGGLIGLAVAWRCRQRGLDVTVHDPAPGGGAAAVAAGMLAPTGEARAGEEALGALMLEAAARWPGFAAELTAASGLDLGYDRCGTLLVALTDDDLREIRRQVDYYQRLGQPIEPLTGRQVRDREPLLSPRVRGGAWAPGDHQVNPRRVLRALLVALRDTPI